MNNHKMDNYGDILSPKDVREILGIGNNKIYELLNSGAIRSFKIGRERKIPKECLTEYIDDMIGRTASSSSDLNRT